MLPSRTFKVLAVLNLGLGVLFTQTAFSILVGVVVRIATFDFVALFLGLFLAALAFSLVQAGWVHLRTPTRKTAFVLATNSAVVVFGSIASILHKLSLDRSLQPASSVGAILVAYAIYRWVLKPLAMRGFAAEAKNA